MELLKFSKQCINIMKIKFLHYLIPLSLALLFFVLADTSFADGLVPSAGKETGSYTVDSFVELGIIASNLILGLVGSLSLIMFVYGGVTFIISGGSSEKIGQAKKILVASVVGLLIVFSSFLIIRFALDTLGWTQTFDGTIKLSNK